MRSTAKIGMIVAAGALAVAVPAAASPTHPSHPATPKNCAPHRAAYIAYGTIVSWSPTAPTTSGPYTGTVTVMVTRTNHHGAPQKDTTFPYALTGTKVQIGKGLSAPYANDRVKLIGSIMVAKKCTASTVPTGTSTITVRKLDISAPKPTK